MRVPLPQLKPMPAATEPPDSSMTPSGTWADVGSMWPSRRPRPIVSIVKYLRMTFPYTCSNVLFDGITLNHRPADTPSYEICHRLQCRVIEMSHIVTNSKTLQRPLTKPSSTGLRRHSICPAGHHRRTHCGKR